MKLSGVVRLMKRVIYRFEISRVVDPNLTQLLPELSPSTKFQA